jgi:hypothetical protein
MMAIIALSVQKLVRAVGRGFYPRYNKNKINAGFSPWGMLFAHFDRRSLGNPGFQLPFPARVPHP